MRTVRKTNEQVLEGLRKSAERHRVRRGGQTYSRRDGRLRPMPELLTDSAWTVEDSQNKMEAAVDLEEQVLRAPQQPFFHARALAAHEQAHIKWTPKELTPESVAAELSVELGCAVDAHMVNAVEDARINKLLLKAGITYLDELAPPEEWPAAMKGLKKHMQEEINGAKPHHAMARWVRFAAACHAHHGQYQRDLTDVLDSVNRSTFRRLKRSAADAQKSGAGFDSALLTDKAYQMRDMLTRLNRVPRMLESMGELNYGDKREGPQGIPLLESFDCTKHTIRKLVEYHIKHGMELEKEVQEKAVKQKDTVRKRLQQLKDTVGAIGDMPGLDALMRAITTDGSPMDEFRVGVEGHERRAGPEGVDGLAKQAKWGVMQPLFPALSVRHNKAVAQRRGKYRSADSGCQLRYIHRWWGGDKRVFGVKRKTEGGTVLFDVSGSMGLTMEEVHSMLKAVPALTVAMYSGQGNMGVLTLLAYKGRRVKEIPDEGMLGGNVVDGPALVWLSQQVRPRLWVSDGYVTGPMDGRSGGGHVEFCKLVCEHGDVLRVPDIDTCCKLLEMKTVLTRRKHAGMAYQGAAGNVRQVRSSVGL